MSDLSSVETIAEIFSDMDPSVILDVLEGCKGNVDEAIEQISQMTESNSSIVDAFVAGRGVLEDDNEEQHDVLDLLTQVFPEIGELSLSSIMKYCDNSLEDVLEFLLSEGDEDSREQDDKIDEIIEFTDDKEKEEYELLIGLFPQHHDISDTIKLAVLELLRAKGLESVQEIIIFSPDAILTKLKSLKKKQKKERQKQNRNKHQKLQTNTGKGNSLTSQWNTGDLIQDSFKGNLDNSVEFPKGTTLQRLPKPANVWSNSKLVVESKYEALCLKYPQVEPEIIKDILVHESHNRAVTEKKIIDILNSSCDSEIPEVNEVPGEAYYNPDAIVIPGKTRYRPDEKKKKNTFIEVNRTRPKRQRKNPGEFDDISAFDARKEANNRRQLLQAYIRCAANAAQSHQHDKVKEYTQKCKRIKQSMDVYNDRAYNIICSQQERLSGEHYSIDLHGLFVREAIGFVDETIQNIISLPLEERPLSLEIVTGVGNRSGKAGPKLKPAVINYLKSKDIAFSQKEGAILVRYPRQNLVL